MHELYELKEKLCDELKEYGSKNDLTAGRLEVVDKLAHAVKNLDKIIEAYEDEEGGYSEGWMPRYYYNDGSYADGRSYRNGNRGGNSNRSYRGRSYARRRDSMGRYSRDGMADKLRELMEDAPDDKTREEIRRLADKMESM